jgi:putative aldouronate transport system permease protein
MIKRKAKENTWFYFFNTVILILFSLMIIVPIWNILVSSVSSSSGLAGTGHHTADKVFLKQWIYN